MPEASVAGSAPSRAAPRSFLIRFDDDTLARLNGWVKESGCSATHLIVQIVKQVLAEDAACHGEHCDLPRLTIEAQLVFSAKLWRRGFTTAKIARAMNVPEAAVANAIEAMKKETGE